MARQKMGSVVGALFVVYWFSLEPVAIGKRGDILSCDGGQTLNAAVSHDGGVAGCFYDDVLKTKSEAEGTVSLVFSGYYRACRVDIVNVVRPGNRGITPENH